MKNVKGFLKTIKDKSKFKPLETELGVGIIAVTTSLIVSGGLSYGFYKLIIWKAAKSGLRTF
jgi:hypothetical protein